MSIKQVDFPKKSLIELTENAKGGKPKKFPEVPSSKYEVDEEITDILYQNDGKQLQLANKFFSEKENVTTPKAAKPKPLDLLSLARARKQTQST